MNADTLSIEPVRAGIVSVTAVAAACVAFDVGGPVRTIVTLLAVLVAPGLSLSLLMGPMTLEARVLISIVASAVLLSIVGTTLALLHTWSPNGGFGVIAVLTLVFTLSARRPAFDPDGRVGDRPAAQ